MADLLHTLSGKPASSFAFGTMQFGVGTSEEASRGIYEASRGAGLNVFDTAYGYTDGLSEQILGRLIAKERDDILLMTKCAHPAPSTAQNLTSQFDESRRRLNQDMVDVLFLHRWDDGTPLEESFETLAGFRDAGQIRAIGVSNFSAWQVMKAQKVAQSFGLSIDVIQPMYNLVKRQVEVEILPMAADQNIAVTPYSPLGGGLLTGKYKGQAEGRLVADQAYAKRYSEDWAYQTAEHLTDLAASHGQHPATLAVAWVARNPDITSTLISGKSLEQLQPSLDATQSSLSDDLFQQMSDLSRTPPPATDRLEEA